MRAIFVLLTGLAGTVAFAETDVVRLSEPVESTPTHEVFGAPMAEKSTGMSLGELLADESALDGEPVRVTTRVARVCQKKGCFFVAQEGDAMARVTFADYGFFIPTDAGSKTVTLVGTLSRRELTPEQAEHYAKDLGEPAQAPLTSDFEYAIVATSVLIPRG